MKQLLRTAFDIREGEYARAVLMQANIFLIVLALLIVKPVVNALFLTNVGVERLPVVFVLVAIAAMIVSSLYARELGRLALDVVIRSTVGMTVAALVVLDALLVFQSTGQWIYYLLYITVAIFGVVTTSQVWILANLLFNTREASRLFGFIAAGAIAGGITGGYVTSILAPLISNENLILVAAAILSLCIPLSSKIWKLHVAKLSVLQHRRRMTRFADHPIKLILGSRHLLFLASIVGLGVIVAKLVDFQFSALASASIDSSDDLAAFFGFWFSTFNVVSLVIQLFLTRRIVGMYGVGLSLFVLPGALFFGSVVLFFFPVLAVGVFLKATDVTLKQSINKSATELLALPIPTSIKNQSKSFIDIFVDSAATGIGGLMLVFMISGLDLSVRFVSILTLPLVAIWIYFAIGVRREYLKSFKSKIALPDAGKAPPEKMTETIIGGLKRELASGAEKQILYILGKAAEERETRLFDEITDLLDHDSPRVRAEALRTLYFFKTPNISVRVEEIVGDPNPEVRVAAVEYLVEHAGNRRVELAREYLDHEDAAVSAAALVGVAREARNNAHLLRASRLDSRLREEIEGIETTKDPDARKQTKLNVTRAIGLLNDRHFYPDLDTFLSDPDPEIVKEAILSAAATMDPRFTVQIARHLTDGEFRDIVIEAFAGCGRGILEVLSKLIRDGEIGPDVVRWLPKVAEQLPYQASVTFLFGLIEHDHIAVQIEALRSLNELKIRYPHLVVDRKDVIELIIDESRLYLDTIAALFVETQRVVGTEPGDRPEVVEARKSLVTLLERRLDMILERIFRLLGLKYPPAEIISIYEGIQSHSQTARVNSVDYLDNLLYGNLKRILMPIVETALLETVSEETIRTLKIDVPEQKQCFEMLLDGRDVKVKQAVLYLIEQMRDDAYLPLIRRFTNHPDARIRDFARRAESEISGGFRST